MCNFSSILLPLCFLYVIAGAATSAEGGRDENGAPVNPNDPANAADDDKMDSGSEDTGSNVPTTHAAKSPTPPLDETSRQSDVTMPTLESLEPETNG